MQTLKKQYKELKKENPFCVSFNHYLVNHLVLNFCVERVFLPVFIDDKKVKFTNVLFHEKSSGDDYFLILVGNSYKLLSYSYEPDCDGAYYSYSIVPLSYLDSELYECIEIYTNDVVKILKNLY